MTSDWTDDLPAALAEARDDAEYRQRVRELASHDPAEVWRFASALAARADTKARVLAVDVLGEVGALGAQQGHAEKTLALFRSMLGSPQAVEVVWSIARAGGKVAATAAHRRALFESMAPFAAHEEARVREAVALSAASLSDPHALRTLIMLSADRDAAVRGSATFALAHGMGEPGDPDFVDASELREALAARVNDSDEIARSAAVTGLALRLDARALPWVRAGLEASPDATYVYAAERLAHPSLVEPLERLAADAERDGALDDEERANLLAALEACRRG